MVQYGFDRAWFSVVFLFLLCFKAHLYEANGGTDMEVLACFRPVFFKVSSIHTLVLIKQGRLERTETNLIHFQWEVT